MIIAIALIAILVIALIWIASLLDQRYNWMETYRPEGDQPYDINLFKEVLKESYGDNYLELDGLFEDTAYLQATNTTMLSVQRFGSPDSSEFERLKKYVSNGNAFFLSSASTRILRKVLDLESDNRKLLLSSEDDSALLALNSDPSKAVRLFYAVYNEAENYNWYHFDLPERLSEQFSVEGTVTIQDQILPNLIFVPYGKGKFIFHSTPLAFTNYHFRNDSAFSYTQALLNSMPNEQIFYIEPSTLNNPSRPLVGETPLRFILSQPPLKWAWYLIIALTLLYVITAVKRKQRSIPIAQLPSNQVMAYLDVVYRLFRREGNHKHIVATQVRLLQQHLREKYRLSGSQLNEEYYKEAAIVLQMDRSYLKNFFTQVDRARHNSTLTDQELLEIDKNITEFYLKCP